MAKLVALYKPATDQAAFDKHYNEIHLPLTNQMPDLLKVDLTYFSQTPMGDQPPYHLQANLYFKDVESLKASMSSPQGRKAAKDLMSFAGSLVTMMISED